MGACESALMEPRLDRGGLLLACDAQCLVPLLGAPLLAWTLESLALGGVKHVYLFVRIGVEAVREYLEYVPLRTCLLSRI